MTPIENAAYSIVNQLGDVFAEKIPSDRWVPVRQATNDEHWEWVEKIIALEVARAKADEANYIANLISKEFPPVAGSENDPHAAWQVEGGKLAHRAALLRYGNLVAELEAANAALERRPSSEKFDVSALVHVKRLPTHNVHRVGSQGFEETPCWCAATANHRVGEEKSETMPTQPYMRRFHETYPGMVDQFHTYCPEHPEYGDCGDEASAHASLADHISTEHTSVDHEGHEPIQHRDGRASWCNKCGRNDAGVHHTLMVGRI